MKVFTRTILGISLPALLLATGSTYAAARLQSVESGMQASGKSTLRLRFDSKVGIPKGFVMKQPASIVLDFPNAERGKSKRSKMLNERSVKSVRVAGAPDKLRVMVALNRLTKYTTSIQGNDVVLTFEDGHNQMANHQNQNKARAQARARQLAAQKRAAQQRQAAIQRQQARKRAEQQQRAANARARAAAQGQYARPTNRPVNYVNKNLLGPIDFQRTNKGGGRAVIKLPHPATVVETTKSGNSVVLVVKNVKPREPRKRIDVLDFATPASFIDILKSGRDVQIKLSANSAFEFNTQRNGNNFIVTLDKAKPKKKKFNPLAQKKKVYKGKKLSLNFQDIEVRSVLQLLADFTDKNIVVSDSVTGNITLRLKDVPWDQALDIVLESKGLAMRSNGNVIWVARASELEAKEQRELQAYKRKQALEPLITEYIPINYAKASEILELLQSDTGTADSAISLRGHVSVDGRTNTLIVRETASRVAEIRGLIQSLDVPVKQVSIESRIVIATDEFGKELGARFGVTAFNRKAATSGTINGTNSMINDLTGNGGIGIPSVSDRLNVNMPVINNAGRFALSVLSGDYLLDLELSALQAENKGEIISTPRVVTADKKKALIEQGVEIPYLEASSSGAATVSFKKAVLSLEVTPQVTPDDNVIMDLRVNQDTVGEIFAGVPSINTREVNTQVLVENGQTIVLGGVHEEIKQSNVSKVPVLGDVPVFGRLFRTDVDSDEKRELLIFVTPKLMR